MLFMIISPLRVWENQNFKSHKLNSVILMVALHFSFFYLSFVIIVIVCIWVHFSVLFSMSIDVHYILINYCTNIIRDIN